MTGSPLKPRRIARAAMLMCAAVLIGGCGWTARDEFYRNRSLVMAPQAGDGSQISASHQQPGAPLAISPQMARSPGSPAQRQPQ
jgi:hypothetical protein